MTFLKETLMNTNTKMNKMKMIKPIIYYRQDKKGIFDKAMDVVLQSQKGIILSQEIYKIILLEGKCADVTVGEKKIREQT